MQNTPQSPPVVAPDPVVQQVLGNAPQTNNGQPDGTPTAEQVRQNRINVMKAQHQETNEPFDPTTGLPVQNMAAEAQQPPLVQQTPPAVQPPLVQPPVAQVPPQQPPNVQTPPAQQPVAAPPQPQQQQPPATDPIQQQFQQPAQTPGQQPPADPNAPQQPPLAPAQPLTPEQQQEQAIVQRLEHLMQPPQQQQQVDPIQTAILQNQQALLQLAQQNPQFAQMPMVAPQPQVVAPPVTAMAQPPQQTDPFSWDAPPQTQPAPFMQPNPQFVNPQMQAFGNPQMGADPSQMLFGHAINQLTQQVNQLGQTNQQLIYSQKRNSDIQNLMAANGINRVHAERAQDYFEQGNLQAAAEVIQLASAPVIAKRMATEERDVRRDAAGQPLTPAPQSGVFATPNEQQAKLQELAQIQAMPQSENKRLAIIGFVQRNPEFAAAPQPGALQTQSAA